MKKTKLASKRLLSFLVAFILAITLVPSAAFADELTDGDLSLVPENTNTEVEIEPFAVTDTDILLSEADEGISLAATTPASDFYYRISPATYGYGVYILGYTGSAKEVVVPGKIDGENVLSVLLSYTDLEKIDVSACANLRELNCYRNKLTSLNVNGCSKLEELNCDSNQLTSLNVSTNPTLKKLDCSQNKLTNLNVSENIALENLIVDDNQLTTLDVSKNTKLESLRCGDNRLTTLDVSKNTKLKYLKCYRNRLTSLNVSNSTALEHLDCDDNQLKTLDVSKNTNLEELLCSDNQLQTLDVSKNTKLLDLRCNDNQLSSLDVSKNTKLELLRCHYNHLTALDISKNTELNNLWCQGNSIKNTAALETWFDKSGHNGFLFPQYYPPSITTTSLPSVVVGEFYYQSLEASGSTSTWTVSSGSLPKGLALTSYGTISGTPTTAGTSTFTVKATNQEGSATKQFSIKVVAAPVKPTITTTSLAGATVGKAYSQKLTASGDTPITWTLSSGSLPKGLSLASNGTISGTPSAVGSSTFTVKAKNSVGEVTKQFTIKVDALKPTITTTSLADATVGKTYSQKLAASGTAPITWTLSSGALPKGLKIATDGTISGTPTVVGSSTFTVKAANSAGNVTKSLTIKVVAAKPAITTTSLTGGTIAKAYSQKLAATGTAPITWEVSAGALPKGLKLATDGTISGTPTALGTSTFTVKATNAGGSATKQLSIKVGGGTVSVAYSTHVQNVGWQAAVKDGAVSGTSGRALRLEGIKVNLTNTTGYAGGISYATHIQNIGWQKAASVSTTGVSATQAKGTLSGTEGRALRLEAITMSLTGDLAKHYDIYYRVHAQNVGWMGWAKNGEYSGTAGHSFRLEAIQVVLVAKGATAPPNTYKSVTTAAGTPRMIDPKPAASATLGYSATVHIQNVGDKTYSSATNSTILGTSGRGLRLEAMTLKLKNAPYSGSIKYETHIQNIGWQAAKTDGGKSGTSGRALRLEALRISLTGDMGKNYDVYYRTHIQNIGWTGWAKNGQSCGSAGYSYRMEAMQIVIVPKGSVAPGLNSGYFYQKKK
ncbi:MAG: putative Ig domain-containing protein [Eggerthellaceae bacterium]|nr:putative Ig domain-containing protein [Eggerthellaceae bacterium]